MKRKISFLFLIPTLLLTSCNNKNKNAFLAINDLSNNTTAFTINASQFSNLIKSDLSFIVYIGNDYCSTCQNVTPIINDYVKNNHKVIYHYNSALMDYQILLDTFPTIFREIISPEIMVFSEGKVLYRTTENMDMKENRINKVFNAYQIDSHIYSLNNLEGLSKITKDYEVLFFTYATSDLETTIILNEYLMKQYKNSEKAVYLINEDLLTSSESDNLKNAFKLDSLSHLCFTYQDEINVTIDYKINDLGMLDTLITNYLQH